MVRSRTSPKIMLICGGQGSGCLHRCNFPPSIHPYKASSYSLSILLLTLCARHDWQLGYKSSVLPSKNHLAHLSTVVVRGFSIKRRYRLRSMNVSMYPKLFCSWESFRFCDYQSPIIIPFWEKLKQLARSLRLQAPGSQNNFGVRWNYL